MKRFLKATWIFYPLIIAVLMYLLLPLFPEFTEYVFSRVIFKIITIPVGFISSLVPFSLTELLVVLAVPLLVLVIALFVRAMKKSSDRKKTAIKATRCTCCVLSFALLMYMICHGANYYRLPMEHTMGLDTSQKNAEHLLNVCIELAEKAKAEREGLPTDENGLVILPESIFEEMSRAKDGYKPLVEEYPFLWTSVWRQKPVMLSYLWSYTGISGMYFPIFAENNVNIEGPDYTKPFTAAHESAHSRGIALENECNYLAFLSCINSPYQEYRYSGYMSAFVFCSNDLYAYDVDLWAQANAHCSEGMIKDFIAQNEHIDRFQGKVWDVSTEINDTFIKVQGVEDGELSYGRVTELILAYYDKLWN